MKVAIIEDEKLTAKDLIKTLGAVEPNIEIITTLHSVSEALLFFKTQPKIDLIFSDIELGDGLSFDIFEKIPHIAPIIFCTAYQQYTLNAFKTAGIEYILKPFSVQSIAAALQKFKELKQNFSQPDEGYYSIYAKLKTELLGGVKAVIVHQGDKIIPISGNDIAFFYVENEGCFAYTFQQKKYLLNQNLESLEKSFPQFFRANRQFLLNRKAVADASHFFHRKLIANLIFTFKEPIIISKLKTTEFIQWLSSQ